MAVVMEGGDSVIGLAVAHQVDSAVGGADDREEEALILYIGLTLAVEPTNRW